MQCFSHKHVIFAVWRHAPGGEGGEWLTWYDAKKLFASETHSKHIESGWAKFSFEEWLTLGGGGAWPKHDVILQSFQTTFTFRYPRLRWNQLLLTKQLCLGFISGGGKGSVQTPKKSTTSQCKALRHSMSVQKTSTSCLLYISFAILAYIAYSRFFQS